MFLPTRLQLGALTPGHAPSLGAREPPAGAELLGHHLDGWAQEKLEPGTKSLRVVYNREQKEGLCLRTGKQKSWENGQRDEHISQKGRLDWPINYEKVLDL